MTDYQEVFGGSVIKSSQQTYQNIELALSVELAFPIEQQREDTQVLADLMDVNATAPNVSLSMPDARSSSTGAISTFTNVGSNNYTVRDNNSGAIITVAPGEAWLVYLVDNTTIAGAWRTFQLGATVSVANASALAGAGLEADGIILSRSVIVIQSNLSVVPIADSNRAKLINWTGGVGIANLPDVGLVGANWSFYLRNGGSGDLTLTPASGTIDGGNTLIFSPGDSRLVVTDGTDWYSVGVNGSSAGAFDFLSLSVSGAGDFVLSGVQLDRVSYSFTGTLTGDRVIVVPNTVQQYWVENNTSGAFDLALGTAGQVTPASVPAGSRVIFYCNGTEVVNANDSSISFPIPLNQGGTGGTTQATALTALGAVPTSRSLSPGVGMSGTGLGDLSSNRTINAATATTGAPGVVELATQTEADVGTDSSRVLTPQMHSRSPGVAHIRALESDYDFTNNDVSAAFLTSSPMQIGETYLVEAYVSLSSVSGGWELSLVSPAGPLVGIANRLRAGTSFTYDSGIGSVTIEVQSSGAGAVDVYQCSFMLSNVTATDSAYLFIAQDTADVGVSVVRAGSYLRITKVTP